MIDNHFKLILNSKTWGRGEITSIITNMKLSTSLNASSTLEFTSVKAGNISFHEGDKVGLYYNDYPMFNGIIFKKNKDRYGKIITLCYDNLRYLQNKTSFSVNNENLYQILNKVGKFYNIPLQNVAKTNYYFRPNVYRNKSMLSILSHLITEENKRNGENLVLYSHNSNINLIDNSKWIFPYVLGDNALVYSYNYYTSVDKDFYNSILLEAKIGKNQKIYRVEDKANIEKYGRLEYYESINRKSLMPYMKSMANAYLEYYKKRSQYVVLNCLGYPTLRAGMRVKSEINGLGDINLNQYIMAKEVTHYIDGTGHRMRVEGFI